MLLFRRSSSVLSRKQHKANSLSFEGEIIRKTSHGLSFANLMAFCAWAELGRLENTGMALLSQPHDSPALQTRKPSVCSTINSLCDLWQITAYFWVSVSPIYFNSKIGS